MNVNSVEVSILAEDENFNEIDYLAYNTDVGDAVRAKTISSGLTHFNKFGKLEGRRQFNCSNLDILRKPKMIRLKPHLRPDLAVEKIGDKLNFLTSNLKREMNIVETENVSSNDYDGNALKIINDNKDGLVLDCGAGNRSIYYSNVINYEIVNYLSTDVLGVGEELPFLDNTFDGIISIAVLEHVRNPFRCADEISRVLKPGGQLYCCVPFLQPYHGYPHHYFNATAQGIRRLFEENLKVIDVSVIDSMHPIFSLQWILNSWRDGLPVELQSQFDEIKVSTLLQSPLGALAEPFCSALTQEKRMELASATVLSAVKLPV